MKEDKQKGTINSTHDFAKNQGKDTNFEISNLNGIQNKIERIIYDQDKSNLVDENRIDILDHILNAISPVNFREYCKLQSEKDKLFAKHYRIACVEILLQTANKKGFNLCRKSDFIYLYNTKYWENLDSDNFKDFLGKVALKMKVGKFDAKDFDFKEKIFKQFISDASLKELKTNNTSTLVNLENGTFEITLKKQFLRDFNKEDFITYQLPFKYDKEAKYPIFQQFLNTVLPQKELQNILAEYIGYIFVKNSVLKLEKVLLLYGSGANGKSVLFEIIMALLGRHNVTNYSLHSLTSEQSKSRINLSNKLLNYASEINGKLESSIFKALASGEPVEADVLYKQSQIMTDYAKFIFNCNELPKEVENTNAFFRRFIILPFKVTIPPKEQDKNLSKKIIESELSGVFNWVLNGLERLLKQQDFSQSAIVENEILQYQKESDSVLLFLDEKGYKPSHEHFRTLSEIYSEYKYYCQDNGYRLCSNKTVSVRLEKSGFIKKRQPMGQVFFIE